MSEADLAAANAPSDIAGHPERDAASGRVWRYPAIAIALHWLIALGIIGMIALGWTMGDVEDEARAFALTQVHKSIGLTILALTLARVVWRLMNPPPPEPMMGPLQSFTARAVHVGFYALMVLMPLTGWIMVSASPTGIGTRYFDLAPFAHIPGLSDLSLETKKSLQDPLEFIHSKLAWVTIALLGLHLLGAFKHQFADKDHLMARMLPSLFGPAAAPKAPPRGVGLAIAASVALLAAGLIGGAFQNGGGAPPADADASQAIASGSGPAWTVDPARSSIVFRSAYKGRPFEGRFNKWEAQIQFDPAKPEAARVRVTIPMASVDAGDPYFTENVTQGDWFDVSKHPIATFEIRNGATHLGGNRYEAGGVLTIRGDPHALRLPFTLDVTGGQAHMRSETTLKRLELDVGRGTPAAAKGDEDWVANDVGLIIDLHATRR